MKTYQWCLLGAYVSLRYAVIERLPKPLREAYIKKKLKRRKGKCNNCGLCCYSRRKMRYCKHYDEKNKRCKRHPNWGIVCNLFPLDELNLKMWDEAHKTRGTKCGFYFVK